MTYALAERIATLQPSATEEVDNAVKRMRRMGVTDIISLGVGEPCFDTAANIKWAAQEALQAGVTKYQPTAGDYELREAISAKLARENGIQAGAEDVIVTPGAKFAIYLACMACLQPGDRAILLDPAWVSYGAIIHMAGAESIRIPTSEANAFQPDLEAIGRAMGPSVKLIIVNSPCNPTAAVYDPAAIRDIAQMADRNGCLLLSDEIYETLIYEGRPYSPGSEFENVVTVNGFSKSDAMTGWRLGYAVAPPVVREGMIKIYQHSTSCVTAFAQAGAVEALRAEASRQARTDMLAGYRQRRALMVELLERSEFFNCLPAAGAFYCFPAYRSSRPSVQLAKELLEGAHVATVPGAAFGACGEGHLRLSYASELADIREAMGRIERYMKSYG